MINSTIAHYKITAKIGKGGMGEVYRATDTKLDRDVAIKILPESFAGDRNRVARFKREAKILATLNHPNIAAIYGIEKTDKTHALVMELVEGETLGERLKREPMTVEESLDRCKQIAEALEAAHEKGIIHRDLKPENIKITAEGHVKVLDFGLAKELVDPAASMEDQSDSPTVIHMTTAVGELLGTAPYMSPEQARAKPVDKRSDIWSFGCVLFECLTGKRMFSGEDVTETLASIIKGEPEWALLPENTPPTIHLLLRKCLNKDRKRRLQHIGDARIDLEQALGDPTSSIIRLSNWAIQETTPRPGYQRLVAIVAVAIACLLAVLLGWSLKPDPPATGPTRAQVHIVLPDDMRLAVDGGHPALALSGDGSRLVFVATDEGIRRLYRRDIYGDETKVIAGTEGARAPFFSPDDRWIGFFVRNQLMKVSSSSGAPMAMLRTTPIGVSRGATWTADETVVMAGDPDGGLSLGSVAGGTPRPYSAWEPLEGTAFFWWPAALPTGQLVIFMDTKDTSLDEARIGLLSLDTREITRLENAMGTNPRYSQTDATTGHILYGRGGSLYAIRFDVQRRRTMGNEFKVLSGVMSGAQGALQYAVGGKGRLVYISSQHVSDGYELIEINRKGEVLRTLWEPKNRLLRNPRLSPDGKEVALTIETGSNVDVWLLNLERGPLPSRLTTNEKEDFGAEWHPTERVLALVSEANEDQGDGPRIAIMRNFGDPPEFLTRSPEVGNWELSCTWSADGAFLVFEATREGTDDDLLYLSLLNPEEPEVFLQTQHNEGMPRFSPNGRWIAYVSDETRVEQVYVRPFPPVPGEAIRISSAGGTEPMWNPNGSELFYRYGDRLMASVVDDSGDQFFANEAEELFDTLGLAENPGSPNYDVYQDGTRFIVARPKRRITTTVINVVFNWRETLGAASKADR